MGGIHHTRDLLVARREGARIMVQDGDGRWIDVEYRPQFPRDPNPWRDVNGDRHRGRACAARTQDSEGPWVLARLLNVPHQRG